MIYIKFLEEGTLILEDSYAPNKKLKTILKDAEKNRDNRKYWKSHSSVRSLIADLKK